MVSVRWTDLRSLRSYRRGGSRPRCQCRACRLDMPVNQILSCLIGFQHTLDSQRLRALFEPVKHDLRCVEWSHRQCTVLCGSDNSHPRLWRGQSRGPGTRDTVGTRKTVKSGERRVQARCRRHVDIHMGVYGEYLTREHRTSPMLDLWEGTVLLTRLELTE